MNAKDLIDTVKAEAAYAYACLGVTNAPTPQEFALSITNLGAALTIAGLRLDSRRTRFVGTMVSLAGSAWLSFENQRRAARAARTEVK